MTTDTSERGLERLICTALTGAACDPGAPGVVRERPADDGAGWHCGATGDYDREYCVDLEQLSTFLTETQPEVAAALELGQGRSVPAQVPGATPGRGYEARHYRRVAPRQARGASAGPLLRDVFAGQREGQ